MLLPGTLIIVLAKPSVARVSAQATRLGTVRSAPASAIKRLSVLSLPSGMAHTVTALSIRIAKRLRIPAREQIKSLMIALVSA